MPCSGRSGLRARQPAQVLRGRRKPPPVPAGQGRLNSVRGMRNISVVPSSAVAALGLSGGFLAGRWSGRRDLAGMLCAAAGAWCAREWYRSSGPAAAAGLSAVYAAAMGGSHPLARRIGHPPRPPSPARPPNVTGPNADALPGGEKARWQRRRFPDCPLADGRRSTLTGC
jgi:hypothetical protein